MCVYIYIYYASELPGLSPGAGAKGRHTSQGLERFRVHRGRISSSSTCSNRSITRIRASRV